MIEIYFVNHEKRELQRIGMADNNEGLFEILQYLIDGMKDESAFDNGVALHDMRTMGYIDVHKLRVKSGLRKRTFDEKLKNIKTWKWEE